MRRSIPRKQPFLRRSLSLLSLLLMFLTSAVFYLPEVEAGSSFTDDIIEFDGTFDWYDNQDPPADNTSYVTYTEYRTTYCTFATSPASGCDITDNSLTIRFDTAEELYRWSIDVSFSHFYASETSKFTEEQVGYILDQNYVLGTNIDYSTMAAKTFAPIGYLFTDVDEIDHQNYFTGTFDGQGFAISNLYVGGYEYMVFEDEEDGIPVDIAHNEHYSMFVLNGGYIHDLGLIDPTLEMLNLHIDITTVSNLVGHNLSTGEIDHVFVIDTRTSVTEAGIRYKVGTSSGSYEAAGIVHTNDGIFTNAYYSSIIVVNGAYFNKFAAQPVLYTNTGTYNHLVYDSTVYMYPTVTVGSSTFLVTAPNALATGESTTTLKSSTLSSLNHASDHWTFFPGDCYPLSQGLSYDLDDDVVYIDGAVDLAFFARLLAFTTGFDTDGDGDFDIEFNDADYVITADIDMGILAPDAYKTPSVNFLGSLTGDNPAYGDDDLNMNYYIHNLTFSTGTLRSSGYYVGLFSVISGTGSVNRLNISGATIALTDTESYYSNVFYVGTVTGRLLGGTIDKVLVQTALNLGTTSLGETHAGGIAGQAAGTISQVALWGSVNAGTHVFNSAFSITPNYYIGGIVGSATSTQLTLSETRNNASITGFATSSTFNLASGSTAINVKIGGIVGYLLNTSTVKHSLVEVANMGGITVGSVINSDPLFSYQNVGGVFGELAGNAPVLESAGVYRFANLYNSGNITATYAASTATIRSAGIGVNNASEAVEYAMLFNYGTFVYNSAPSTTNSTFRFTGTIYDIGSSAVTLF